MSSGDVPHGGGLGGEIGVWSFPEDDLCAGEGVPGRRGMVGGGALAP
jgi:hypothetical protein